MLILETERLLLRPYQEEDIDALHQLWTSPGVRRYLFDNEIIPRIFVEEEIRSNVASFDANGWGQWTAQTREVPGTQKSRLAGFCGFRPFHDPPQLELLFGVDERHWGKGFAGEMARCMIALGFTRWGFERIQGSTDTPNVASIRVMEKLGMRFVRREETNGLDTVYYEITPDRFDIDGADYRVVESS